MISPQLISYSVVKTENFSSKIRNNTRMLTLTPFIQHSIGSPIHSNQKRKRNKTGKEEVKLSLYTNDMITYISKILNMPPKNY